MKVYESGIILDPQLEESNFDKQIEQVESLINSNGGKVLEVNRWGMRRLAFEINKKQQGYYVFFVFQGDGSIPQKLERSYILNESIMRFMTVVAEWYEPSSTKDRAPAEASQREGGRGSFGEGNH